MEIAIPSYKRPNDNLTPKFIKKGIIYCHDFEVEDYRKNNDNEVRSIPDELAGKGMGVIRNFILDNTKGEEILMLDDDIRYFGYYEETALVKMKEDEFYDFAENAFRMIKELGTKLWGLNLQSDKKFYREYSPFSLSSVVLGPCLGVIKDTYLRFDDDLGYKEDYDYSLSVLRKFRKILRFNKFHYSCGHIRVKGGLSGVRTFDIEMKQAERFQRKWGKRIVKIKRNTQGGNLSINPVIHAPIKGI